MSGMFFSSGWGEGRHSGMSCFCRFPPPPILLALVIVVVIVVSHGRMLYLQSPPLENDDKVNKVSGLVLRPPVVLRYGVGYDYVYIQYSRLAREKGRLAKNSTAVVVVGTVWK